MHELNSAASGKAARLSSLDIFRGITIAAMITVNNPGIEDKVYPPLEHAKWNGITPTDFIFPSFLFMVGVSVAFSYSRQRDKGVPYAKMLTKTARRAVLLFFLGVFLSIFPYFDFTDYRIPGVLQRIAIVYACSVPLFLYTNWKTQIRIAAILLVGYWLLMTMVPVPGYGYPILEPGHNLAAWLDARVIPGRLWQKTWDPEGILSTFPSIATGIIGMLTGTLLLTNRDQKEKVIYLLLAGFVLFAFANVWNLVFPLNKNLWTSSFVCYVAGLDLMALASLYFLVDIRQYSRGLGWARIFGTNAIAAYLVAEVLGDILTFQRGPHHDGSSINSWLIDHLLLTGIRPENLSVLWAILFCGACFIPIYFLYRKKLFLKI